MNKRFLFLVAWVEGTESAAFMDAGDTNVHENEDLLTEYKDGNESVLAVEIFAPNSDVAAAIGWRHAITEEAGSYTLDDTLSDVIEIGADEKLVPVENGIEMRRFVVEADKIVENISK